MYNIISSIRVWCIRYVMSLLYLINTKAESSQVILDTKMHMIFDATFLFRYFPITFFHFFKSCMNSSYSNWPSPSSTAFIISSTVSISIILRPLMLRLLITNLNINHFTKLFISYGKHLIIQIMYDLDELNRTDLIYLNSSMGSVLLTTFGSLSKPACSIVLGNTVSVSPFSFTCKLWDGKLY